MRCIFCQREGHLIDNCPYVLCKRCFNHGHLTDNCQLNKPINQSDDRYFCHLNKPLNQSDDKWCSSQQTC